MGWDELYRFFIRNKDNNKDVALCEFKEPLIIKPGETVIIKVEIEDTSKDLEQSNGLE